MLFEENCVICHKNSGRISAGYLYESIDKYEGKEEWLISYILDARGMAAKGDPEAIALYESYNKQNKPSFPQLSRRKVSLIVGYLKFLSEDSKRGD
ncbi:MAG: hypothetical protein MRZ79_18855 [Bacteroidia bacterium]|nr:hypothetical protein [Bacteroidia bacterium]